ncbi:hypothetical protein PanWU01x14_096120, partial [Parasponia andersonii]
SIPRELRLRTPNEISDGLRDRAYQSDPSASTTDLKIYPNYKNITYVAPRRVRAKGK